MSTNTLSSITSAVSQLTTSASHALNGQQQAVAKDDEFHRLPADVQPIHYDLKLIPDLEAFTFAGEVTVALNVKKQSTEIVVNGKELKVESVHVVQGSETIASSNVKTDDVAQLINITLVKALVPNQPATLYIKYEGILNDQLEGFYRSSYKSSDGSSKTMACTQFESTSARRAFPCWDEPAIKATFSVIIHAPQHLTVVSNMPEVSRVQSGERPGWDVHTFVKTPIMSTYILAFVVGEFEYVEDKTKDGVLLRVFTQKGVKHQGQFALDTGKRALEFYNQYFGIPYPLPKMDQLAIPDFSAGAMENWGCITYREAALLVDPDNSSTAAKERIALTVCHEIAHQWFGNIVTMEWWTHLWLIEGYANWMEYFCVNALFPEWNVWSTYVFQDLNRALDLDALANSHAIEIEVKSPDEVDEIFDAISYSKGSAVIRMLENYLGSDAFQKGLHTYLTKYKYANALTDDLWRELELSTGKPVSKVMQAWTRQTGFPLLSVHGESSVNSSGKLSITLSQRRFFADGSTSGSETWPVPISFVLPGVGAVDDSQLLYDAKSTIELPASASKSGQAPCVGQTECSPDWHVPSAISSKHIRSTEDRSS